MKFTHLTLSTDYSLLYGMTKISRILQDRDLIKEIDAIALTDLNNCFGAIDLSKKTKAANLKAIYGCNILVKGGEGNHYLYLLARTPGGYKSMMKLLAHGITKLKRQEAAPLYSWDDLRSLKDVICITGGMNGELGRRLLKNPSICDELIQRYADVFSMENIVIDVHRIFPMDPAEELYNARATQIAAKFNIPVVATNYVAFLKKEDFLSHEVKYSMELKLPLYGNVGRIFSPEQYFKTASQMTDLFSDMPEAIANISYVVQRCNVVIPTDNLPIFPKSHSLSNISLKEQIDRVSTEGLNEILKCVPEAEHPVYHARLQYELNIIYKKGYADYFIMVSDIVKWAKEHGIAVGPGRGSGGGSLLAYSMAITDIDPIVHNLMFERFLNLERSSFVDFDVDFCADSRAKVIDYIKKHYGEERVSYIISYSKLTPRAAIRNVSRVYGISFLKISSMTNLIPTKGFIRMQTALDRSHKLKQFQNERGYLYKMILHHCLKLEDVIRGVTRHAAGILVSHTNTDNLGVYCCEGDEGHAALQWDKDALEEVGFLKMDILGLRNLTSINRTIEMIQAQGFHCPDLSKLKLNDHDTLELIKTGETDGVFQLESHAMQKLVVQSRFKNFNDIVAIISLYRPGPVESGMTANYVAIKQGEKEPEVLDEKISAILQETYGLIVYQEQIMKVAEELAGFSLGRGDSLQRAISKKKPQSVKLLRGAFIKGGLSKGIDENHLQKIFGIIEKFAGYGFNRSHAAAYALTTYRTAYLKAHFPTFFYIGLFSQQTRYFTKYLLSSIREGIIIMPPSINKSDSAFTYVDGKTIRYGLSFIKGLSTSIQSNIFKLRKVAPFTGIDDFIYRCFGAKSGKAACSSLILSGAMDEFGYGRNELLQYLEEGFRRSAKKTRANISGRKLEIENFDSWTPMLGKIEWVPTELLQNEVNLLKISISNHLQDNKFWLEKLKVIRNLESRPSAAETYIYTGILIDEFEVNNNTLVIHTAQFRNDSITIFMKSEDKVKSLPVGTLLIMESEKPVYFNKFTHVKSLGPNKMKSIEEAVIEIVQKQIITIGTKKEIAYLIQLFSLIDKEKSLKPDPLKGLVPMEIRYLHADNRKTVINLETHFPYKMHFWLKRIGKLSYIFK